MPDIAYVHYRANGGLESTLSAAKQSDEFPINIGKALVACRSLDLLAIPQSKLDTRCSIAHEEENRLLAGTRRYIAIVRQFFLSFVG